MPKAKSASPFDFEKSLSLLDEYVEKLEEGELNLDEALKYFENGIKLIRECQIQLTQAEQKVKILLEENGKTVLKDFDESDLDEDESE